MGAPHTSSPVCNSNSEQYQRPVYDLLGSSTSQENRISHQVLRVVFFMLKFQENFQNKCCENLKKIFREF